MRQHSISYGSIPTVELQSPNREELAEMHNTTNSIINIARKNNDGRRFGYLGISVMLIASVLCVCVLAFSSVSSGVQFSSLKKAARSSVTSTEKSPSYTPTFKPTMNPTTPTFKPSTTPTYKPTLNPVTVKPSWVPTAAPTYKPSTATPTYKPSANPTNPTFTPSTAAPSFRPTTATPTKPTLNPTTVYPSRVPTVAPRYDLLFASILISNVYLLPLCF